MKKINPKGYLFFFTLSLSLFFPSKIFCMQSAQTLHMQLLRSMESLARETSNFFEILAVSMQLPHTLQPLQRINSRINAANDFFAALEVMADSIVDADALLNNIIDDLDDDSSLTPEITDHKRANSPLEKPLIYSEKCPICLEEFQDLQPIAVLLCGHIFCSNCANYSLSYKQECPICRENPINSFREITFFKK